MLNNNRFKTYSVFEINEILDVLKEQYDIVRLVDVEECRIVEVQDDGSISYGNSCFSIWSRKNRCANCSSLRACLTRSNTEKIEHLGRSREKIHSIPISLELRSGEIEICVIECVKFIGVEGKNYQEQEPSEYINTHDVLTRLYTHEKILREIRNRLNQRPDESYVLSVLNIRNFSTINKLFGTENANRLLTGIADILREICSSEEIYGRMNDDRFVLLIKKDKFRKDTLIEKMQGIRSLIESPVFIPQVKMGIYEITNRNFPISVMIEHANIAVNSIRDERDIQAAYYKPSMMLSIRKNQYILSDFDRALREGDFHIFLQPQTEADGQILGGEVLVRWIRPDGDTLMPSEFIGILHNSELLSHMDIYIWEKAVRLLNSWKNSSFKNQYISVNVDPMDFYYIDVPKILRNLCEKYDVPPKNLRVEITETALADNIDRLNRTIDTLHQYGFLVEIDDFGKGYSSLSLLKNINADILKIDMDFIQGEKNPDRGEVILSAIIEMADRLHMGVIMEGVETGEQVKSLIRLGCRHFQGFFFSRPIPVSDFEMILSENLQTAEAG
ncbi:MAG: EAL domain-containing protein [Anaerolineaceae bacterium]|nr:EAL domain-containing protein [Anaerolineaceae bacterium]